MSPPFTGVAAKDVVAGLLSAHGAAAVARAAVKEAASRGARVRFLQVSSDVSSDAPASRAGPTPQVEADRSEPVEPTAPVEQVEQVEQTVPVGQVEAPDPAAGTGALQESNATFTAALRALREFPRVPVTFEVATGEPGAVLVERTRDAEILVLAADLPGDVADYCRRHAACDILSVRPTSLSRLA